MEILNIDSFSFFLFFFNPASSKFLEIFIRIVDKIVVQYRQFSQFDYLILDNDRIFSSPDDLIRTFSAQILGFNLQLLMLERF